MSSGDVEHIHHRIREELTNKKLSLAEAARRAGERDSQRLKDVVAGKQKCPIDLLARLIPLGIDFQYVLTGQRSTTYSMGQIEPVPIGESPNGVYVTDQRQLALLDNYEHATEEGKRAVESVALLGAAAQHKEVKQKANKRKGNQ